MPVKNEGTGKRSEVEEQVSGVSVAKTVLIMNSMGEGVLLGWDEAEKARDMLEEVLAKG